MTRKNEVKYALNLLKKYTGWSWEKMARNMSIALGHDGVAHTTLFRVSRGVGSPNTLTKVFVRDAIEVVVKEEVGQNRMTIVGAASIMSILPDNTPRKGSE